MVPAPPRSEGRLAWWRGDNDRVLRPPAQAEVRLGHSATATRSLQGMSCLAMRRAVITTIVTLTALLAVACSSPTASPGKVVCPSSDRFSCYYPHTDSPVRGPRTIDGYRVVGVLPAYCTQKSKRCSAGDVIAGYNDPTVAKGSHPTGEYLEWNIRGGGRDGKVATYVSLAQELTHDFGQLPAA
jgi:hypothetical protein